MPGKCSCNDLARDKRIKGEDVNFPYPCPTVKNRVHVKCQKCGERIALDLEELSYDEAKVVLEEISHVPRECPGFHVELGGWDRLWQFDEALKIAYGKEAV